MSVVLPIQPDSRYRLYTAALGQVQFAIPFPFQQNEDISLFTRQGNSWVLVDPALYQIAGAGEPGGGTLTFLSPRLAGDRILVLGEAILDRLSSIVSDGRFSSNLTDSEFDRNRIIQQEQERDIGRAVKVGFGQATQDMPDPAPGNVLGWDDDGRLENKPTVGQSVEAAEDAADRAEAAAAEVQGIIDLGVKADLVRGNVAVGSQYGALTGGALNTHNVAVGVGALVAMTDFAEFTAIGDHALNSQTGGNGGTAVGTNTLRNDVTGMFNTGVGSNAGKAIKNGNGNTALGHGAMGQDDFAPAFATGSFTTALGGWSFQELTTGGGNTGCGMNTGVNITTGQQNAFFGLAAGAGGDAPPPSSAGNSASYNTGMGAFALQANKADGLVAIGFSSMKANLTGTMCTAIGYNTLSVQTAAVGNTVVGYNAGALNTTGGSNTHVGRLAGNKTTTGSNNTSVGDQSLVNSTTASDNTAIGAGALFTSTTGFSNTAVGRSAATALTTGSRNTVFGALAANSITTGSQNTALGAEALNGTNFDNSTGVGYQAVVTGSNQVQIGNSATTAYVYGTVQNRSDVRDKADIRDTEFGLDFIMKLRPVDFRWDLREDYFEVLEDGTRVRHERDGTRKRSRYHHGFIAQEISPEFGGLQDHSINGGDDVLSLGYDEFVGPIVKGMQQLVTRLSDELEARDVQISELQKLVADLSARLPPTGG